MNRFIVAFIVLMITLSALPNGEAYPGGFCCKTFGEEEPTPASETRPTI